MTHAVGSGEHVGLVARGWIRKQATGGGISPAQRPIDFKIEAVCIRDRTPTRVQTLLTLEGAIRASIDLIGLAGHMARSFSAVFSARSSIAS
jgi:hypothetical protein